MVAKMEECISEVQSYTLPPRRKVLYEELIQCLSLNKTTIQTFYSFADVCGSITRSGALTRLYCKQLKRKMQTILLCKPVTKPRREAARLVFFFFSRMQVETRN